MPSCCGIRRQQPKTILRCLLKQARLCNVFNHQLNCPQAIPGSQIPRWPLYHRHLRQSFRFILLARQPHLLPPIYHNRLRLQPRQPFPLLPFHHNPLKSLPIQLLCRPQVRLIRSVLRKTYYMPLESASSVQVRRT